MAIFKSLLVYFQPVAKNVFKNALRTPGGREASMQGQIGPQRHSVKKMQLVQRSQEKGQDGFKKFCAKNVSINLALNQKVV